MLANQSLEDRVKLIEAEIIAVKQRNRKVEFDKAWEGSRTRAIAVMVIIYLLSCLIFFLAKVSDIAFNSFIAALGFALSNQTVPWLKARWVRIRSESTDKS